MVPIFRIRWDPRPKARDPIHRWDPEPKTQDSEAKTRDPTPGTPILHGT